MLRKFVGPNTCTACRPAGSNGAGARAQVEAAGRGVGEADPGLHTVQLSIEAKIEKKRAK